VTDWSDPQDTVVARCLTVKCGLCKALPGVYCRALDGGPLPGRLVHHFRLDKLVKDDE
jgi:hypothetical protein